MSPSKPITISIPHPCTQSWDEMTPCSSGRFCDHCKNTVIDFTTWSDEAIYNILSKNQQVCGRFCDDQMNRPISIPHQPNSALYRLTVALGLTILLASAPAAYAQSRAPFIENNKPYGEPEQTLSGGELRGKVLDDKKEPAISIVVQAFQNGVLKGGNITDYEGNFVIKPLDTGQYDVFVLSYGYDSIIINKVPVTTGVNSIPTFTLPSRKHPISQIEVIHFGRPAIDFYRPPTSTVYSREEIQHYPH